jgi:hypothetical protein
MGHRAGLDAMERRKLLTVSGLELESLVQPVASVVPGPVKNKG